MNSFDKKIKEKLTGHNMPVSDDMWAKVSANLIDETPSKKIFYLWFFAGALFVSLLGMGYNFITEDKNDTLLSSTETPKPLFTSKSKPIPNTKDKTLFQESISKTSTDKVLKNSIQTQNNTTNNNSSFHNNSINTTSKTTSKKRNKTNNDYNVLDIQTLNSKSNIRKSEDVIRNTSKRFEKVPHLSSILNKLNFEEDVDFDFVCMGPECYSFGRNPVDTKFSVDVYGGPLLGMNSFTKSPNSVDIDGAYMKRRSEEKELIGYTAGVRMSVMFNRFGLRAGLNYSHNEERFDYTDPNVIQTTITTITIDTIYNDPTNPNLITDIIRDTISVTKTGSRIVKHHNKYTFIDIPVMLAFEKELSDKWVFNINGGVMINVLSINKGKISSVNDRILEYDNTSIAFEDVYKTSVGLSLIGSIGINYKLNDNLQLLMEPQFRQILNSISTANHPLQQKQSHFSFVTGLRYTF